MELRELLESTKPAEAINAGKTLAQLLRKSTLSEIELKGELFLIAFYLAKRSFREFSPLMHKDTDFDSVDFSVARDFASASIDCQENYRGHMYLGDIYTVKNHFDRAKTQYLRAIELHEESKSTTFTEEIHRIHILSRLFDNPDLLFAETKKVTPYAKTAADFLVLASFAKQYGRSEFHALYASKAASLDDSAEKITTDFISTGLFSPQIDFYSQIPDTIRFRYRLNNL